MPFPHVAKWLCLLASFWLAIGLAAAEDPQRPFGTIVEDWNHSLELISQELAQPDLSPERAAKLNERLAAIRAEAEEVRHRSEAQIAPLRQRAEALLKLYERFVGRGPAGSPHGVFPGDRRGTRGEPSRHRGAP